MKPQATLCFRPRPDQRAWLEHFANAENRSLNSAMADLIDRAMRADPLRIVVRKCDIGGSQFFDVSVGESAVAFHETHDLEDATTCARLKAKELGLRLSSIQYRVEDENGTPFGQVVQSFGEAA